MHLDLSQTGLSENILTHLSDYLRKNVSLNSVHLCHNQGLTAEVLQFIKTRIKCKEARKESNIITKFQRPPTADEQRWQTYQNSIKLKDIQKTKLKISQLHQDVVF